MLFYMSKDDRYAASQSITTVGVVEQVIDVTTVDDLIRHTAKRSVFSADDLSRMTPSVNSAVKTIDFLLAGHIEPPVRLDALIRDAVLSSSSAAINSPIDRGALRTTEAPHPIGLQVMTEFPRHLWYGAVPHSGAVG